MIALPFGRSKGPGRANKKILKLYIVINAFAQRAYND